MVTVWTREVNQAKHAMIETLDNMEMKHSIDGLHKL
jgi:hypothetical protein